MPTDSLLWGRLMAWQLSGNAGQEIEDEQLRRTVNADLLPLLLREEGSQASLPEFSPTRSASNNWALSGARTASGSPILSNDPHLGLTAPGTWYMARISTPDSVRVGATVPGLPLPGDRQQRPCGLGFHHHAQRHPGPVRGASV